MVEVRSIALIGSSGGGTATLGHTEPGDFIKILQQELSSIRPTETATAEVFVRLTSIIFVALRDGKGMDSSTGEEDATLYFFQPGSTDNNNNNENPGTVQTKDGKLKDINQKVAELALILSDDIYDNKIQGLISVSSKPSLFSPVLTAAAKKGIPLTGTGGSSLSLISSTYNLRLVGNAGGSVATTPMTKAISFSNAFAREWHLQYKPWKKSTSEVRDDNISTAPTDDNPGTNATNSNSTKHFPSWKSVLNSCLPAFWAVVLCKRLLLQQKKQIEGWLVYDPSDLVVVLESWALPLTCAIIMASSRSTSPGALMGSVLAASTCRNTIIGGLFAGWIIANMEEQILHSSILYLNAPATMTNLISSGLVGIVVALALVPITGLLSVATAFFRNDIINTITEQRSDNLEIVRIIFLCMLGAIFCYGSKVGWYHSIFLPIILIEMETGNPSFFGAVDFLTLVLVSAGICAGAIVTGCREDVALMKRGMTINLLCGDFIEVCYPLMEESSAINLAGYVASAISTAICSSSCKSSAYLPFPIALWLADDWKRLLFASLVAAGVPFVVTVSNYYIFGRQLQSNKKSE